MQYRLVNHHMIPAKDALAYRLATDIHHREYDPESKQRAAHAALIDRRKRLTWHVFWITMGAVLAFLVTFITSGLWLKVGVLGTAFPAYAQEVTDFIKAW